MVLEQGSPIIGLTSWEKISKVMEVYKLEKDIENDKLDLHMAMEKVKKCKDKLTHSLQRRKESAIWINKNLYIDERIEDLYRERILEEANIVIEDLLGINIFYKKK